MRDWVKGSNEWQSIAFYSDGKTYNVPEGLIFSFPVTTANGKYKVVEGLKLDDADSIARIKKTTDELLDERKAVEHLLK
jgi:malate dehydrogenase